MNKLMQVCWLMLIALNLCCAMIAATYHDLAFVLLNVGLMAFNVHQLRLYHSMEEEEDPRA